MQILENKHLDFEDVLILPQPSEVSSRADVNLNVKVGDFSFPSPIVVANMDTTGTIAMEKALGKHALVALHKFYTNKQIASLPQPNFHRIYSMGTKDEDVLKLKEYIETYVAPENIICVDVANAYNKTSVEKIKEIRRLVPNSLLVAGNIATYDGAKALYEVGVDIVKVGIGPGSVCETRRVAGVGVPQFSAIIDCAKAAKNHNKYICADGGIRTPGDAAKAIAAGADLVMIGGMFAGTDECEGEWEMDYHQCFGGCVVGDSPFACKHVPTKKRLKFYGMSSKEAMEKYHGGVADYRASEGRCEWVNYKGPALDILRDILGGIRSACTYSNAKDLTEFREHVKLITVKRIWI